MQDRIEGRPFVVVFVGRSGSTALYGNLRSHPQISMMAEVFGNPTLPGGAEQTDANRLAFLDAYWQEYRHGNAPAVWKGFKFQIHTKRPQFGDLNAFAAYLKQNDVRIIGLKRLNLVKQIVSHLNAQRLKDEGNARGGTRFQAHVVQGEEWAISKLKESKLRVDIKLFHRRLQGLEEQYRAYEHFLGQFDDVHSITYEDYLMDKQKVLEGCLAHLGVEPRTLDLKETFLNNDERRPQGGHRELRTAEKIACRHAL